MSVFGGRGRLRLFDKLDELHAYVADWTIMRVAQEKAMLLKPTPKESIGPILVLVLFSQFSSQNSANGIVLLVVLREFLKQDKLRVFQFLEQVEEVFVYALFV